MFRAIIVDDEPKGRDTLCQLIKEYCPEIEVVGQANSADSAYELIQREGPDIVFLDVEMPNGNGFDLLKRFDEIEFHIIFTTAFGHYALQAIKYSALDYLLKPVDVDELEGAVAKLAALETVESSPADSVAALFSNLTPDVANRKVAIPDFKGLVVARIDDIVRCEADGNYTELLLRDGGKCVSTKSLKQYEDLFMDAGFLRIHRTHLINMTHVQRYLKEGGGYAVMTNGDKIEISRRKRGEFLELLGAQ